MVNNDVVTITTVSHFEYDQTTFFSLVRDLNGLIEKLNTTFQEEKTEDNDAVIFFLGS